jgi:hypothetical protein
MRKTLGKEVTLSIDVRTRWNSIITMIDTFSKVSFQGNYLASRSNRRAMANKCKKVAFF